MTSATSAFFLFSLYFCMIVIISNPFPSLFVDNETTHSKLHQLAVGDLHSELLVERLVPPDHVHGHGAPVTQSSAKHQGNENYVRILHLGVTLNQLSLLVHATERSGEETHYTKRTGSRTAW